MIVLDASAVLEWLLRTPTGSRIQQRIDSRNESLHAPHLLYLEVAQVLRRLLREGRIPDQRAHEALTDLLSLRLLRYPHDLLLPRVWQYRNNLSAYDAAYVVLAERLNVPLITCDARLASSPGHGATIELI